MVHYSNYRENIYLLALQEWSSTYLQHLLWSVDLKSSSNTPMAIISSSPSFTTVSQMAARELLWDILSLSPILAQDCIRRQIKGPYSNSSHQISSLADRQEKKTLPTVMGWEGMGHQWLISETCPILTEKEQWVRMVKYSLPLLAAQAGRLVIEGGLMGKQLAKDDTYFHWQLGHLK